MWQSRFRDFVAIIIGYICHVFLVCNSTLLFTKLLQLSTRLIYKSVLQSFFFLSINYSKILIFFIDSDIFIRNFINSNNVFIYR